LVNSYPCFGGGFYSHFQDFGSQKKVAWSAHTMKTETARLYKPTVTIYTNLHVFTTHKTWVIISTASRISKHSISLTSCDDIWQEVILLCERISRWLLLINNQFIDYVLLRHTLTRWRSAELLWNRSPSLSGVLLT
jgi:hypothetical protein